MTGCWWGHSASTALLPASASNVVGQHNKIGAITSGEALICYNLNSDSEPCVADIIFINSVCAADNEYLKRLLVECLKFLHTVVAWWV